MTITTDSIMRPLVSKNTIMFLLSATSYIWYIPEWGGQNQAHASPNVAEEQLSITTFCSAVTSWSIYTTLPVSIYKTTQDSNTQTYTFFLIKYVLCQQLEGFPGTLTSTFCLQDL